MKKKTIIIFVLISIVLGVIIGSNLDRFLPNATSPRTFYSPRVTGDLAEKSKAFSDIVKSASPTVVNISSTKIVRRNVPIPHFFEFESPFDEFFAPFRIPKKQKEQSLGSGVIVSSEGYIITNYHVIEKADEIKVTLSDKKDYRGKVIGSDPKTDIAVLKISAKDLSAIKWGDSDKLAVGEFVLAFGNPFGFSNTVTMGIISALGRANVGIAEYEDFIQTDAAINPGNSGGPLVNIKGEIIGINTAIYSRTGGSEGIGFAVPSNMVQQVMEHLVKKGKVTRGWLGVTIQQITPELAKQFDLKDIYGALISDIARNSPAEKAGLKRGDVITEINGKTIKDITSLKNIVAQSEVGSTLKLKVIRAGKTISINAVVAELPKDFAEATPEKSNREEQDEGNTLAGFSVIDLTQEIAKQLGLSRDERGVVIVRVEPDSSAEDAGLKKGDVIQEINKKRITNSTEFNTIAQRIREGDTVLVLINRGGHKVYVTLKANS